MNRCPLQYILVLLAAGLASACGNPEVIAPTKPMEVVHMPLDGMVDADFENVRPMIYFSDDVDPSSVNTGSVKLESSGFDGAACGAGWESVAAEPSVDEQEPRVVIILPGSASSPGQLLSDTCYLLTCTTGLKGVTQGPLENQGVPGRPGTGAMFTFRTRAE